MISNLCFLVSKVTGVLQRIKPPENIYTYYRSKRNKNQVNQNDNRQTYHIVSITIMEILYIRQDSKSF